MSNYDHLTGDYMQYVSERIILAKERGRDLFTFLFLVLLVAVPAIAFHIAIG